MIGKKINQLATELAPASTDLTIIGDPISGVSKKITLAQLGAIFSGAVSFYTNLAGFPATGDINVIYCAKDTQKLYLWSGSAYVEVFPSQALLDTYQLRSEKGVSNGYASLDSSGKVPVSQLPSSIMEYKGTWNAATNTPTLANGTGDTGDVYICNVAGTVNFGAGAITFAVGDYVIYSGTIWQRSSGAVGTVTSVAASITGNAIGITGSPVTTSGTLAFAFAGTGAQYIKGDGTLATFPSTIAQAERLITEVYNSTGATLTKGTIVYINGGQGNLPTVTKALATGDSTSAQTFGVVQADITNMNNGYVVVAGKLSDLDTQAYTEGTQLYLSSTTAGTWTSTKQYAPAHLVYVGIVVRSHPTQGIVEIKIQNGYELDELHNVAAQTPTNNDGLFWESATSLWKNKSIATVLGYTPQPQLSGTGFVKISGTTISYDNSTYLTTSAAATTYLPMVLSSTANSVDINGQQFSIYGSAGGFTSGRIIVDPVFSAIGYQNAGVFDGLKILTNGNAEFSNSGVTRFFNQVRFDSTLTNGTYTYTLPSATGTIALVGGAGVGTVTSVGLSSATSGVTIGSSPITTSGTITLAIATASGLQNGLLSSSDWTTFNNKQNALTNPVTGTGTTNYLPKFTGTSTIGNSIVQDSGSAITIGGAVNVTNANINLSNAYYLSARNNANTTNISLIGRNTSDRVIIDADGYGTTIGGGGSVIINPTGGDLLIGTTTPLLSSTGRGNITINGSSSSILAFGIASALSGYIYSSSSNLELDAGGARFMQFNTNGNERMRISASGNLSIGNTNDTYKLDVSGTGRYTGIVTFGSTGGSGLRVYGGSGTNQWDVYLNSTNLRFSDNTGTGSVVFDRPISGTSATFSSSVTAVGLASTGTNHIYNSNELRLYNSNNTNWGTIKGSTDTTNGTISLTGGTGNGIFITNGGNVGIGTTSPQGKLDITGGSGDLLYLDGGVNTDFAYRIVSGADDAFVLRRQHTTQGGLNIMSWTYSGNVGIGTTSPSTDQLVIYSPIAGAGRQLGIDGATGNYAQINFLEAGATKWRVRKDNSNEFDIYSDTYGGSVIHAKNNGQVGIGTTSPQNVLDLGAASNGNGLTWSNYSNLFSEYSSGALWMSSNFYGNIGSSGYKTSLTATFGAAAIKVSGTSGSGNSGLLQFYVDDAVSKTAGASFTPTERMRITSGGLVGIGTSSPTAILDINSGANSPIIRLTSSAAGQIPFSIRANIPGFSNSGFSIYDETAAASRLVISSTGNVGIGTTSPSYNLEVWTASSGSLQNALNVTNGANADFTVRIKTSETWIGPTTATPLIFANSSNTERMRIKSNGIINLSNVPSSSAGLISGDIYKTVAGVLMIV